MQTTGAAAFTNRRRIIAIGLAASAVAVSATYWFQVRRLEVSRDVWPQFLSAIREDDPNRLRSLIDGQSIRLNQNSSVAAALIIDPSGIETRGTIMPLDGLLNFPANISLNPLHGRTLPSASCESARLPPGASATSKFAAAGWGLCRIRGDRRVTTACRSGIR